MRARAIAWEEALGITDPELEAGRSDAADSGVVSKEAALISSGLSSSEFSNGEDLSGAKSSHSIESESLGDSEDASLTEAPCQVGAADSTQPQGAAVISSTVSDGTG